MDDPILGTLSGALIPAQSYSSEEWEQKRLFITQLYRDERKTVKEIISALVQQSFRPT